MAALERLMELLANDRKQQPLAQRTITIQLAAIDGDTAVFTGDCFPPNGVRVRLYEQIPFGADEWLFKAFRVIQIAEDTVWLEDPALSYNSIPVEVGQYLPIDISFS